MNEMKDIILAIIFLIIGFLAHDIYYAETKEMACEKMKYRCEQVYRFIND